MNTDQKKNEKRELEMHLQYSFFGNYYHNYTSLESNTFVSAFTPSCITLGIIAS